MCDHRIDGADYQPPVTDGEIYFSPSVAVAGHFTRIGLTKDNGNYAVIVRQIVSFKLTNISKDAEVSGYFLPIVTPGVITPIKTTIMRPILVQ